MEPFRRVVRHDISRDPPGDLFVRFANFNDDAAGHLVGCRSGCDVQSRQPPSLMLHGIALTNISHMVRMCPGLFTANKRRCVRPEPYGRRGIGRPMPDRAAGSCRMAIPSSLTRTQRRPS